MVLDDVENLNYDSLEAVAHLRASERYKEIMQVTAPLCNRVYLTKLCKSTAQDHISSKHFVVFHFLTFHNFMHSVS